jgi:hypothetical protein
MENNNLENIIKDIDDIINNNLKGNDHYFYNLAKVNKQVALISVELIKTIKDLDNQNSKLEKTNIKLQWTMAVLTVVTIILTLVTLFKR